MAERILGVDLGGRRVGLATSDPTGTIARRRGTLDRRRLDRPLAEALHDICREEGATTVVIGDPRHMSGRGGVGSAEARTLQAELRARGLTAVLWDERLTTRRAERILHETGRRVGRAKARLDELAAEVILQTYLEHRREKA